MNSDVFQKVKEAENEAQQIIQSASKQSRELLKETKENIIKNERAVALEHRAMYQSIIEAKKDSLSSTIGKEQQEIDKTQSVTVQNARQRLDVAVQFICEGIWNNGNS